MRPLSTKEKELKELSKGIDVVGTTVIAHVKDDEKKFDFDEVYDSEVDQKPFYDSIMPKPLEKFLSGINVCVFCCEFNS